MNKKFKKLMAGILCCVLCILTALFSVLAISGVTGTVRGIRTYADGYVTVKDEEGSLIFSDMDESFFAPTDKYFKYNTQAQDILMPGDTRSGSLTVTNNSAKTVEMSFHAESTGPTRFAMNNPNVNVQPDIYQEYKEFVHENYPEFKDVDNYLTDDGVAKAATLQGLSQNLVKQLQIEVKKNGKTVYKGLVNGTGKVTDDNNKTTMTQNMNIPIGVLNPNESVKYTFTVTVPKTLGNDYKDSMALIDWIFAVSYWEEQTQPSDPEPEPTSPSTPTKPTPPSPGTGEEPNLYVFAAAACGISAVVIFIIAFGNTGKRKKKEEE